MLSVEVDLVTADELVDAVTTAMDERRRFWVANHNLHSVHCWLEEPSMRAWFELADVVHVDGMSLVLASRLGGGVLERRHRATHLDWFPRVFDHAAAQGQRVVHLGGDPDWIDRGAAAWRRDHPGLDLHVIDGFFDPSRSDAVVAEIRRLAPDLLLIGMGMPRQERWAAAYAEATGVPVVAVVGGLLGYAAGASSTPPRWTGRVGLEWLWRLASDPRRLAYRYIVEPVVVLRALRRARREGRR